MTVFPVTFCSTSIMHSYHFWYENFSFLGHYMEQQQDVFCFKQIKNFIQHEDLHILLKHLKHTGFIDI